MSSSSTAYVETDDDTGEVELHLVTDDGEVTLVGDPHDMLHLVVVEDRELNREAQQDG